MLLKLSICLTAFLTFSCCEPILAQKKKPRTFGELCDCPEFDPGRGYRQLADITGSKNEIEIRYGIYHMGHNSFAIISRNNGRYRASYYIAKYPSYDIRITKKPEGPYFKYEINDAGLDTVLNKLLASKIDQWQDPGFRANIADLGAMEIQYKINERTGSYRFLPPAVMTKEHPDVKAYQDQLKIINIFNTLTDSIYMRDTKKRGFKSAKSN